MWCNIPKKERDAVMKHGPAAPMSYIRSISLRMIGTVLAARSTVFILGSWLAANLTRMRFADAVSLRQTRTVPGKSQETVFPINCKLPAMRGDSHLLPTPRV